MKNNNKNQVVFTCINCSQFCKNQDVNKFLEKIKEYRQDGVSEITYKCDTSKDFLNNLTELTKNISIEKDSNHMTVKF